MKTLSYTIDGDDMAEIDYSKSGLVSVALKTEMNLSPAAITIIEKGFEKSYSKGSEVTVDGITAKVKTVKKKYYAKAASGPKFEFTYTAENEPALWTETFSYHFFEWSGKEVNEMIADINEKISPWTIQHSDATKIRQYDSDGTLTQMIKDLGDILGLFPVLHHDTKIITFEDITTYAGRITEPDLTTGDANLEEYEYIEEESDPTGTRVNGVYNKPFYSAVIDNKYVSVQESAWSIELLNTFEIDNGEGLTTTYAEILGTTSVEFEDFEIDLVKDTTGVYNFISGSISGDDLHINNPPEEYAAYDGLDISAREIFLYADDNLHELNIELHIIIVAGTTVDSNAFLSTIERNARKELARWYLLLDADVTATGDYFEVEEAGTSDLVTSQTYYNIASESVPDKLAKRIHWWKQNKSKINATFSQNFKAGDTKYGGRVYSSNATWKKSTGEWISTVEIIGGTPSEQQN